MEELMNKNNNYLTGTVSSAFVRLFLRTAQDYGIAPTDALNACSVNHGVIDNRLARVDANDFEAMMRWLITRAGDDSFGFNSARYVAPGAFGLVGYLIMNCQSGGEALRLVPKYEALIGNLGTTELSEGKNIVSIRWNCYCRDDLVRPHLIDEYLATTVEYSRWVTGRDDIAPIRIYFEHKAPSAETLERYQRYFRCELIFDSGVNVMEFDASLMDLSIRHPDPTLLKTLQEQAEKQHQELQRCDPVVIQVRSTLQAMMERTIPRRERVASQLGMSERTLQRRLLEADSSYQQILDDLRLELSQDWLISKDWSVSDIALRLGFTEPRSFQRRFKTWTGISPGEFRRRELSNALEETNRQVRSA
jgi:AraC-like DNA-binding protein